MTDYGTAHDRKYYEYQLDSTLGARTSSNFTARNWPTFSIGGDAPLENIVGIKVLEVQIPFSWYTITTYNNTFTLNETSPLGIFTVELTPGVYNATELATELKTQLDAEGANTYTVTYSSTTLKYTITNGSAPFSLEFGEGQTDYGDDNPREFLGMAAGLNSSSGNVLIAPNVALVSGPNYLFLNSDKLGGQLKLYLCKDPGNTNIGGVWNGNAGPQVAKIPINVQPGMVIYWSDPAAKYFFDVERLNNLNYIDFYLTAGPYEQKLDLNGLGFSLKIGVITAETAMTQVNTPYGLNSRIVKRKLA